MSDALADVRAYRLVLNEAGQIGAVPTPATGPCVLHGRIGPVAFQAVRVAFMAGQGAINVCPGCVPQLSRLMPRLIDSLKRQQAMSAQPVNGAVVGRIAPEVSDDAAAGLARELLEDQARNEALRQGREDAHAEDPDSLPAEPGPLADPDEEGQP